MGEITRREMVAGAAALRSSPKTNVVFFMTDDHGAWAMGAYGCRGIRTENLKYVERTTEWPSEMYDLEADPGEKHNVVRDPLYQAQLQSLRSGLAVFFRSAGAPPIEEWRSTTRQELHVYPQPVGAAGERRPVLSPLGQCRAAPDVLRAGHHPRAGGRHARPGAGCAAARAAPGAASAAVVAPGCVEAVSVWEESDRN